MESVIVLAAGDSRRMGLGGSPKALLPLVPRSSSSCSFLSRNLELFRAHGVQRVFVVVNPVHRAAFAPYADDLVHIVPVASGGGPTGSTVSLLAGLRALLRWRPEGIRTLVTDADVVYERSVLHSPAAFTGSRLLTVDRVSGDGEEVRVYGRSAEQPVLIGKGLGQAMTEGLDLLGESLGLILLDAAAVTAVAEVAAWIVGDPPASRPYGFSGRLSEHEEVWQYLFTLGRLPVARLPAALLFSECDVPEDYRHVQEFLYPAIVERDAVFARPENVRLAEHEIVPGTL